MSTVISIGGDVFLYVFLGWFWPVSLLCVTALSVIVAERFLKQEISPTLAARCLRALLVCSFIVLGYLVIGVSTIHPGMDRFGLILVAMGASPLLLCTMVASTITLCRKRTIK